MARARAEESETLPEADRLEGFPHPRETGLLIGQDAPERTLAAAFASGRMHHAWLITGRQGIGKATLAYRLARHVLARPEERDRSTTSLRIAPQTAAARQVTALSHPGLLALRRPCDPRTRRFTSSIPVDEVRRVKSFLALTGGQDAWRVVIVDSADELNVNAANALLKSLEEPPQRALFALICSEPSRLLPTIRSRCRRLECSPLAGADLKRAVAAAEAPLHALGERLIPASRLPEWAALWEGALREKNEAVRLNLDRKALLIGMLGRLEALARGQLGAMWVAPGRNS